MLQRKRLEISGVVQGVGFRPYVHRLASCHRLSGFVCNDHHGVTVEIQGESAAIAAFLDQVQRDPPPLARIEQLTSLDLPLGTESIDDIGFSIRTSPGTRVPERLLAGQQPGLSERPFHGAASEPTCCEAPGIEGAPDAAPCPACRADYLDPDNRRYLYPFTNCTACGPRYTITRERPYDRERTTMAAFRQCPLCRREYDDPADRRFHAQPNACPVCGPQLELVEADGEGTVWPAGRALERARVLLRQGAIVAVKNVGGYQLACDARCRRAIERLRRAKRRPAKPLALLAASLDVVARSCRLSPPERAALSSRARPIVLLEALPEVSAGDRTDALPLAAIAPGQHRLGVMLPSSPLHDLLLVSFPPPDASLGTGFDWLVMTSGNRGALPIARTPEEARAQLSGIADAFLDHGRGIHLCADDSVGFVFEGQLRLLRRARGYVPGVTVTAPVPGPGRRPQPPRSTPPPAAWIWAAGAELKNTFCLAHDRRAWLSPHLGDMGQIETWAFYERALKHYCRFHRCVPQVLAYDPHPSYCVTRWARQWASTHGIERQISVQHHHAHIASCMAEHQLFGTVLGVAMDGTGYGPDATGRGSIWGGEWLIATRSGFERAAHLRPLALVGGDRAARQPWRMALSYLADTFGATEAARRAITLWPTLDQRRWRPVLDRLQASPLAAPSSSLPAPASPFAPVACTSAGRLFDAVAALLGLAPFETSYEGEAAMALESAAATASGLPASPYPFSWSQLPVPELDLRPTIAALLAETDRGVGCAWIARRFHLTLAEAIAAGCRQLRAQAPGRRLERICLSGGSFQNQLLLADLTPRLRAGGFQPYVHAAVPANDGGLALGQAAVAQSQIEAHIDAADRGPASVLALTETSVCV